MALRFLLDEHLRGPLWHAIQRHNMRGGLNIDAVRVGDFPDLPLGSDDADILAWADREQRILITEDKSSMPGHLAQHVRAAGHSPGVFMVGLGCSLSALVSQLELVAHAGRDEDYENAITYIP